MATGASFQYRSRRADRRTGLFVTVALMCVLARGLFAQTTASHDSKPPKSSKIPAALVDAEALMNQGLLDQAKDKIQEQLKLTPSSAEAYNLLGILYSNEKNYAKALESFQHALSLVPGSTKTRNNLGSLYVAEGKLQFAEEEFRKVLRAEPGNHDANYNLGLVLMTKGLPSAAITHFQRVRPLNVATRFNIVRAYFRAGRTKEAIKAATQLSAANKNDVQLHFTLGAVLASEKQYRAAQNEFEKANALQPETFEILYNLGQAYLRARDYTRAEVALNRALRLKPESPETLYLIAQVFSDQSRPVDALDVLVRARKLAPKNTDIIFLLARVSMSQNYFEDAIPLLDEGLKISPERPDLHAALGESYFMSGKTEKALEEFRKLIDLDPSARSFAFMGLSYRHLGRFDAAKKFFQEGLKKEPRNASCLFNMGYIEERQGNRARAAEFFRQALRSNPDFPEALFELANLRVQDKDFAQAAELLRKSIHLSRDPAQGYYKLAMVERSLHQMEAAQRDLEVFQTLAKDSATGPYPYQHLFDYLDNRSKLTPEARVQLDLAELTEQIHKHPDQPGNLYLLAEAYLKLGNTDDARKTVAELDRVSANDYRTQTGVGVLLARYHLYDEAIQHFQAALHSNSDSDDVKFDLADAYFRKGLYEPALEAAQKVSAGGQRDDGFLALLGDIYAHLGDAARAIGIYQDAITRNPDNDQYYLSLALAQLRNHDFSGMEETLEKGTARIPGSGKILWGLGLVSVLDGHTELAAQRFERAVDLLPEWAGSYSTLGAFYYQTGQIAKAREVLNRFKSSNAGGLDMKRIEEALSRAPATAASSVHEPMSMEGRQQLLQLALTLADRTL